MLKNLLLAITCLFLPALSFGQAKITLTGTIEVNTGEVFPYRIVFTEAAGIIKGYSFTYPEPDETKAAITGTLDRRTRTLSFKETEIIYSHGYQAKAFMCLIDALTDYVQGTKGKVLKGPITSKDAHNTSCTGGTVTFSKDQELLNLFNPPEKYDTVISFKRKPKEAPVTEVPQPVAAPEPEKPVVTDKITKGIEKAYEWQSDTVVIDIWDGGNVDGDQVTLQYNDLPYLTKFPLTKQKKQLRIPLSWRGTDVITIVADNEGSDPPNTATLMLTDGNARYSIVAYNPKGQASMIRIRKAAVKK